jgi:peptidoglycan/xylan/chitin deacetylase (PgdA/CDA1 family)
MNKVYLCFPGGKHKALTMSYDDGKFEDRRLVELFNTYGIKGTFHINSGIRDQVRIPIEEYPELYRGHEIACHTLTHPTIARCPITEVAEEVLEDKKRLEALIHRPVRGLSYPNGSYSDEIKRLLPGLGIKYSRIVGDSHSFALPADPYEWMPTCHHNHNLLEDGRAFVELSKKQYLYLMYVWGHSYEFTRDNNWEVMEEFCKLAGGRDDIWYATNIEYIDYMEMMKGLQFAADNTFVYNPYAASVWLSVNGEIQEVKGGELAEL